MARLNQGSLPLESAREDKRRLRERNRAIAREKLLCEKQLDHARHENHSLQQENIQLRVELGQARQLLYTIQYSLQSKVSEIGSLLTAFNSTKGPLGIQEPSDGCYARPGNRFEWLRARNLQSSGWEDGVDILPTIMEDRYRVCRTLDADETCDMQDHGNVDEISIDRRTLFGMPYGADSVEPEPNPTEENDTQGMDINQLDEDSLSTARMANLETRKKRRDSSRLDPRKMAILQPDDDECTDENDRLPKAAGTKRKLSVTTEETVGDVGVSNVGDDFIFSHRDGRENSQLSDSFCGTATLGLSRGVERQALSDRTNTPPSKAQKKGSKPDAKQLELVGGGVKARGKRRNGGSPTTTVHSPAPADVINTANASVDVSQRRERRALSKKHSVNIEADSPTSIGQSTAIERSKDTPIPRVQGDADPDICACARPTRRARSQINYAEPNLIQKMRRPTKDLVDAVPEKHQQSGPQCSNIFPTVPESNLTRTVVIKRERVEGLHLSSNARSPSTVPHGHHSPLSDGTVADQFTSNSPVQEQQSDERGRNDIRKRTTSSTFTSMDNLVSLVLTAPSRAQPAGRKISPTGAFDFGSTTNNPESTDRSHPTSADRNDDRAKKSDMAYADRSNTTGVSGRRYSAGVSASTRMRNVDGQAAAPMKSMYLEKGVRYKSAHQQKISASTAVMGNGTRSNQRLEKRRITRRSTLS